MGTNKTPVDDPEQIARAAAVIQAESFERLKRGEIEPQYCRYIDVPVGESLPNALRFRIVGFPR